MRINFGNLGLLLVAALLWGAISGLLGMPSIIAMVGGFLLGCLMAIVRPLVEYR